MAGADTDRGSQRRENQQDTELPEGFLRAS